MEETEAEVHKLIELDSMERSSTQTGLLTLYLCLRRMGRSEFALTFVISTQPVLRTNFCCPSLMSSFTTHATLKGYHLWMSFSRKPFLLYVQAMNHSLGALLA